MTTRLLGGAAACLVIGLVGLYTWEQSEYNTDPGPINKRIWYGYGRVTVVGLMAAVCFVTPGVVLLYGAANHFLRLSLANLVHRVATPQARTAEDAPDTKRLTAVYQALGFYLLLATTFFVVGVVAISTWGATMMSCGVIFCVGNQTSDTRTSTYKGDPINSGIACMIFLSLCPLGLLMGWRGVQVWLAVRARVRLSSVATNRSDHASPHLSTSAEVSATRSSPQGMHRFVPPSRAQELTWLSAYVALLLFFALVSFYMPGDTRHFTPSKVASYARLSVAPYASRHNSTHTAPELPRAYMRTVAIRLCDAVTLKLYPGNVLFFGYCILVMLTVWCVRQSVTSRYWMSRRFTSYPSMSFGEGILVLSMTMMMIFFLVYWTHDHNYKNMWTLGKDEKSYMFTSEILARGFGMLATLLLSFLMFPISRHSVVRCVLGTSYETILWTHRILGYGMLVATALHVVLFFWAYYESGQLWHNVNYIPVLCCSHLVRNDFVIPVVTWTTYIMFIAMGIFALNGFRRRFYEVFYYTHLISTYSMIPVLLWHVASGWQYMLPGLTLWFIDCLIRLFQRSALVTVQYAKQICEDAVELGFAVDPKDDRHVLRRAYPGQYVFISVAEISALQWHPFTLSSAAGLGATRASAPYTVHIKSMGPGTWTQKLYDRVARGEPITLAVEGPCGSPLDVSCLDELFLVCGGIGVTPCASIFGSVLRWARAQARGEAAQGQGAAAVTLPRRVRLIWACRSAPLVQAMAPTLGLSDALHTALLPPLADRHHHNCGAHASAKPVPDQSVPRGVVENGGTATREGGCGDSSPTSDSTVDTSVINKQGEKQDPVPSPRTGHSTKVTERTARVEVTSSIAALTASAQSCVKIGCTVFEIIVYMTRDDEYDRLLAAETDAVRVATANRDNVSNADAAIAVPLQVRCGRPYLRREVGDAYRLGVDGVTADLTRSMIFACGPEELTTDAKIVGAELGIPVHQEEACF